MNIDDSVHAIIPTPITNANDLMAASPNIYIATIAKNVENHVSIDLLMTCQRLVSMSVPYMS